ncbi:MAG: YitT family protein, partial [Hominenteromicrobium sp.]
NGKMFFIISQKSGEIAERIMKELDRGVTFLKSRGGYLKQEGEMLFCAVRRFEVFSISEIIRQTDPDAFVIVGDAGEIAGEGFKPVRSDDRTLGEIVQSLRRDKTDGGPEKQNTEKEKADGR